jgi:predicted ATPase/transcriptional regulator with XRE-family HTH domain
VDERPRLADVLQQFRTARGLSLDRLARDSGLPRATVHRWLDGKVVSPYYWDHLLRLAVAMRLTRAQTNRLLAAAGMPPLHRLAERVTSDEHRDLLAHWTFAGRLHLPAQLTSFIGRDEEVITLSDVLATENARLVTLTGAGGSGKTRLALRVATEVHDLFPDGVVFVPLAGVTDPEQVVPAIARALELRDIPGVPAADGLVAYLRQRTTLLVLDNLEQVVSAGPHLVDLLVVAGGVKLLVTSRVPLHVTGEHEWPVAPFTPPPATGAIDVRNPAVALFLDRARAVRPDLSVVPSVVRAVAELCRYLDGLPLAIELAAARCRTHAPTDLLTTFPRLLDLPAGGPRDVPDRHRTLRATIAWSYGLLTARERRVFDRLAVFAAGVANAPGVTGGAQGNGWSIAAATAVCRLPGERLPVAAALRILADAHLIERVTAPDGTDRFRMLLLIREYAAERLAVRGETDLLRQRHAAWFLRQVADTPRYVPQARHAPWLASAELDLDDHRAALAWVASQDDVALLLHYTGALWPFWQEYGYLHEGYAALREAIDRSADLAGDPASRPARAWALTGLLLIGHGRGEFDAATAAGEEALQLWLELDDQYGIALVRQYQGWARYTTGDIEQAVDLTVQALASWRVVDEPAAIARCLGDLALILTSYGRHADASRYAAEAVARYTELNDTLGLARMYTDIGVGAFLEGDLAGALPLLARATALAGAAGRNYILPSAQLYYGTALLYAGQVEQALPLLAASLQAREDTGDTLGLTYNLLGCLAAARRLGLPETAARLAGAVTALVETTGIAMVPTVRTLLVRELAELRATLGDAAYDTAFTGGHLLPLSEAVALGARVVGVRAEC